MPPSASSPKRPRELAATAHNKHQTSPPQRPLQLLPPSAAAAQRTHGTLVEGSRPRPERKLTANDEALLETVRRRLAEVGIKPWQKQMWCIPRVDATFVACMEDVLTLYVEPADPQRPVVYFDETHASSSARRGSRFGLNQGDVLATTTNTFATARPTSSCLSNSTGRGGTQRLRTNAQASTSPSACGTF